MTDQPERVRPAGAPGRVAPPRRRPWWAWLLIAALLAASLGVTVLLAAAFVASLAAGHWREAFGTSLGALPAVISWAALLLVLGRRNAQAGPRAGSRPERR
jgi:hypothetical protein